jgi:hypothetical protein
MFENVQFFEQMHSKFAKSANLTQNLLSKNYYGVKKAQNFMLIPNSLKWAKKCSSKSYWQKATE